MTQTVGGQDAGLIASAAAGNEIAFRRIIVEQHEDMRRACAHIAGDLDVAEDATQAAWVIAWKRLRDVREPSHLRPWPITLPGPRCGRQGQVVRLKTLGTEISALAPERGMADILSEIEATRRQRERLAAEPKEDDVVDPEDALIWLASLGKLWRETSDEGRRQLALATFERISVASGPERASHRIVSVEITNEAERRGLLLALPASIEVTMVGDTGFEPVTSRM